MTQTEEQRLYHDMLTAECELRHALETERVARRITIQKRKAMKAAQNAWLAAVDGKEAA